MDFDILDFRRLAQAEVQRQGVLRVVAAAAHHFIDHLAASHSDDDPRADSAAVRFGTGQRDIQVMSVRPIVFQHAGSRVHVDEDNLGTAVAIQVSDCQAAGGAWNLKCWSGLSR